MFCNKNNEPKSLSTPYTPDFWLENKMFHNNLCVFIIIPALFYLLHLLSLHKWLFYPPFSYTLYDEYSEDARGKDSSAKYTMTNEETLVTLLLLKRCIFKKLSDINLWRSFFIKKEHTDSSKFFQVFSWSFLRGWIRILLLSFITLSPCNTFLR